MSIGKGAWKAGKMCCGTVEGNRRRKKKRDFKNFSFPFKTISKALNLHEFQSKSNARQGVFMISALSYTREVE